MSDDPQPAVSNSGKSSLSRTLGLGFALGVAAFALTDFFISSDETTLSDEHTQVENQAFTCSMHPQIRQPEMGACPLCGMDLIPATSGGAGSLEPNELSLSERARALARLRTTIVHRRGDAASQLRLLGQIQPDESSLKTITAWTSGRVDRLRVRVTGESVSAGQIIATLYSPEVFAAHQDLTVAKSQVARTQGSGALASDAARAALKAARERLRLLGVPNSELRRLEQELEPTRAVSIRTPFSGTVIERLVSEGAYVTTGTPLFRIAKLDELWVQLDAYESDLARIQVGQRVQLRVEALPGEIFVGQVKFIDPTVDSQRRTARVRVVVDNADGRLRPGMFVEGSVDAQLKQDGEIAPLVIPVSAPLFTGRRALVYVETRDGNDFNYEARVVRLGPRLGQFYPVVAGLNEGERVVTRGAFVLDADLQIRGGQSMMTTSDDRGEGPWDGIIEISVKTRRGLAPIVSRYLEVQDHLAHDRFAEAKAAATKLKPVVRKVSFKAGSSESALWEKLSPDFMAHASFIERSSSIEDARKGFELLSESTQILLQRLGNPLKEVLRLAHCPMAAGSEGASWIQRSNEIENAYFGASMYRCGEFVEEVSPESYLRGGPSNGQ